MPVRLIATAFACALVACRPTPAAVGRTTDAPSVLAQRLEAALAKDPSNRAAARDLALLQWTQLQRPAEAKRAFASLAAQGDELSAIALLIMADARLDGATVQDHAYALLSSLAATRDPAPEAVAIAAYAALRLTGVQGADPRDDARFIAFYDRLEPRSLPFVVSQPLTSYRASIARRRGEDFRPYFRDEGCVQTWAATEVRGAMGPAELHREPFSGAFEPDSDAQLIPLSCVTRVWNPTPRAGVRWLRSYVEVPGTTLALELKTDDASVIAVDGRILARTDESEAFPRRRHRLELELEPGWHRLDVALAIPGEHTWVLARATDAQGAPIPTRAEPPTGYVAPSADAPAPVVRGFDPVARVHRTVDSATAPLWDFLAIEEALEANDSDEAETLSRRLEHYPRFAEGRWLRGRVELADPSRPKTISAAREQRALEDALALAPDLEGARLRSLEIMLERGDEKEVSVALDEAPASALRGLDGELFRFRTHRALGNEHLSVQALDRAKAIHPESCAVLLAELSVARAHDHVEREDAVAAKLAPCAGSHALRANLAETRGRPEEARALWTELLERVPDDIDALQALARLADARGDAAGATELLRRIGALNPQRIGAAVKQADLVAAGGGLPAAKGALHDLIERFPHQDALHQTGEALGITDDLLRYRVDGLGVLADYVASGVAYEGVNEVLVLDRSIARVYPNGGQRHIVHLLVHLLSKDALDRYGEIEVPEEARLLTLRSIKPDGTILEPEVVPGKDGLELRHLEIGDYVEYEFIVEQAPTPELGNALDVTAFHFQSLDVPYHQSELFVVFPKGMPLQVDRRNGAPQAQVSTLEHDGASLTVWHFRAEHVARLGVEPGHRSLIDEVPNVHIYTTPDAKRWLGRISASLVPARRSNPALRRLARALTRGKASPSARFEALWSWVVEHIEEDGDLSTPATVTLAGRRGNRTMLLHALACSIGIESEFWLVRSAFAPRELPGGNPRLGDYDTPILAVDLGETHPLIATTVSEVLPPGYLPPGYATGDALRVVAHDDPSDPRVALPPPMPELQDRRAWTLAFAVDREGAAVVTGHVELQGMEALSWRQALRDVDRDRVEELFVTSELGWLRGADLKHLTIDNERALHRPLVLRFEASAPGVAFPQDDAWILRSTWVPLNTAESYTALPERKTGLLISYAPRQSAEIRIAMEGVEFDEIPQEVALESPWGTFQRRVELRGGELVLHMTSTLQTGVVGREAYPELAAYAHRVNAATQAVVRAVAR